MTAQLPNEHFIYVADSKFSPYGNISNEDIIHRVNEIADWLVTKNCKAIVVACNTATVNAIDQLRQRLTMPIIGVEPAIKPAISASTSNTIGVLVTQATANNQRFQALVKSHKGNSTVLIQPCNGLVELIEAGKIHTEECENLLRGYLTPLLTKKVDTIVLGCTHYPFLATTLQQLIAANTTHNVTLMETALPVCLQLERQLVKFGLKNNKTNYVENSFYSSQADKNQSELFSSLWKSPIIVEKIK